MLCPSFSRFSHWHECTLLEFRLSHNGRDPFNQTFRKFRFKTQWIGSVQPEKFRKNGSTFWGGPLFPVGPVGSLVEWIAPNDPGYGRRALRDETEPLCAKEWIKSLFYLECQMISESLNLHFSCQKNVLKTQFNCSWFCLLSFLGGWVTTIPTGSWKVLWALSLSNGMQGA